MAFRRNIILSAMSLCCGATLAQPSVNDPFVPEANARVNDVVQSGDRVYVAGSYTMIGGIPRNGLAAFDANTGEIDMAWDPGLTESSIFDLFDVEVYNGFVYVCGSFDFVNSPAAPVARRGIARFPIADGNTPATVDTAWNPDIFLTTDDPVLMDMEVSEDGTRLYVTGLYTSVNHSTTDTPRKSLAAFDLVTGAVDLSWDPAMTQGPTIPASLMKVRAANGNVYVTGMFSRVNGNTVTRTGLASFEPANGTNTGVVRSVPNVTFDTPPQALDVTANRIYVGGAFLVAGGEGRNRLAAFDVSTGLVDLAWNPDITGGGSSAVLEVLVANNKVYAVGDFAFVNTNDSPTTRTGVVAFPPADGATAATPDAWNPSLTGIARAVPTTLQVDAVGDSGSGIFVGGHFENPPYFAGFGSTVLGPSAGVEEWKELNR